MAQKKVRQKQFSDGVEFDFGLGIEDFMPVVRKIPEKKLLEIKSGKVYRKNQKKSK